jgi:hypothetical protein
MEYEQPPTEEERQVLEAYRFSSHYRDSVFYLDTIQEYTAPILIQEAKEKLNRKLKRLRKVFRDNSEALDIISHLQFLK